VKVALVVKQVVVGIAHVLVEGMLLVLALIVVENMVFDVTPVTRQTQERRMDLLIWDHCLALRVSRVRIVGVVVKFELVVVVRSYSLMSAASLVVISAPALSAQLDQTNQKNMEEGVRWNTSTRSG
jgi:hypothetical protein